MGGKSIWGDTDNGNQKVGMIQVKQLSYYNIFLRKNNFYGHFQRKSSFHFYNINFKRRYVNCSLTNFKRVASSHEKLYNEQWRIFILLLLLLLLFYNSLSNFESTVFTQTEAAIEKHSGK